MNVKQLFKRFISITIVLFLFLAAGAEDNQLTVSHNLPGTLWNLHDKELTVTFSHDMVPLGGQREGRSILDISPKMEGEFSWRGAKTLVFKPKTRFQYATRYRFAIPAGTRALNGQLLKQTWSWSMDTPLAYPRDLDIGEDWSDPRSSRSIDGFKGMVPPEPENNMIWGQPVWIKSSLVLDFGQPVSAPAVKNFLMLREVKNKNITAAKVTQAGTQSVRITPVHPLERAAIYMLRIKKGFKGIEGHRPINKNFSYFFRTDSAFTFNGSRRGHITADDKKIYLYFSNPLKKDQPEKIKVFKIKQEDSSETLIPLKNITFDYNRRIPVISIADPLETGDLLLLKIGENTQNAYGETLDTNIDIRCRVCSSHRTRIDFEYKRGTAKYRIRSIQQLQLKFYQFNDGIYRYLAPLPQAVLELRRKTDKADFIDGQFSKSMSFTGGQWRDIPVQPGLEGLPYGLWGVTVEEAHPFNVCNDREIWDFWQQFSPHLHVFHHRDTDIVLRTSGKDSLVWVYNRENGESIANAPVTLLHDGKRRALGKTGANGVLYIPTGQQSTTNSVLEAVNPKIKGDKAFVRLKKTGKTDPGPFTRAFVITERHYYKPGDTVNIGGVIRQIESGALALPQPGPGGVNNVRMIITGPEDTEVVNTETALDRFGGFSYRFDTAPDIQKGGYHIEVLYDREEAGGSYVTIDHFQPNTVEVSVSGLKPYYTAQDTFKPVISGKYLSGNPMAGDTLVYTLEFEDFYDYDIEGELKTRAKGLAGFSFSLAEPFRESVDKIKENVRFDNQGRFRPTVPLKRASAINFIAGLVIEAVGKTPEGKEFKAAEWRMFFPGNRMTGVKVPYFADHERPIDAELAMITAGGEPASGTVDLTLYKRVYRDSKYIPEKVKEFKDLEVKERRLFQFTVDGPGQYRLRCDTTDNSGRIISTSDSFSAWGRFQSSPKSFSAETDQKEYKPGDTARIIITSREIGRALVTLESDRILKSEVISLEKTTVYETGVLPSYFPGVEVNVVGFFPGNRTQEASARLKVESQEKRLSVDIRGPAELKPGTDAQVKFKVKDAGNRGRKAGLFVYAVDEGYLSVSGYGIPDLYYYFYSDFLANYFSGFSYRTYYPENYWQFKQPVRDIPYGRYGVCGRVTATDGKPLPDVEVVVKNHRQQTIFTTCTSAQGYYYIGIRLPGEVDIRFNRDGYRLLYRSHGNLHPYQVRKARSGRLELNTVMITEDQYDAYREEIQWEYGGVMLVDEEFSAAAALYQVDVNGKRRVTDVRSTQVAAALSRIHVRQDFQPVLFFKKLETDENGEAVLDFKTSDLLTTYRITAIAYTGDGFGSGTKNFTVSKDLLMQETMPEFARRGDTFEAGVLVSNRKKKKIPVTVRAEPEGLRVTGSDQQRVRVSGTANTPVHFSFHAPGTGEASVRFYARSKRTGDKDGLLKKLAVSPNLVKETLLDFDAGKEIKKQVLPQTGAVRQQVAIKVAPSILRPAVKIAEKLVFYPYECLEQRTSKMMPYLALSDAFVQRLELKIHLEQARESIQKLIREIPEFMHRDGALAYYRRSPYASDYLTAYVLWALHLARQKGYDVPEELTEKIEGYLESGKRDPNTDTDCFFQYISSLTGDASPDALKRLMQRWESLSLVSRVFLYKAMNRQLPYSQKVKKLPQSFFRHIRVEADFAYYSAPRPSYYDSRSFPFYSNRYATALALIALLETDSGHPLVPRMMNWLMQGDPHCWNTTQTNFWILYAMDRYMHKIESTKPTTASVDLEGKSYHKTLVRYKDVLKIEKDLDNKRVQAKTPVEITVAADRLVYLTTELNMWLENPGPKSRGIKVTQNVYDKSGKRVTRFKKGNIYQVELLLEADKNVPYTVIDAPLAAGFELMRKDFATTRTLEEFNRENARTYVQQWASEEHAPDRVVFYTYRIDKRSRLVYFVKAMYKGEFTWVSTIVQGMYHPQYFGRTGTFKVRIE